MVLSNESGAIYFREKGHAVYGKVNTPLSIVTHLNNTNDKRWVWVKPLAVGFCGSDYEGGWLKFPTGSRRFDNPDYPAVAGHENISVLLGGSEESLRHLEQRGISIGDYVVADVNIGCGYCKNDSVGKPPIQCVNGAIFAGIGTPPDSEKWLYEQTGRTHLPGAYVAEGGFMIVPGENVHKVPNEYITQDGIQLYTQADGIACGLSTLEKLALGSISPNNSLRYPSILILGAGHIGYLNGRVIKERVPEARLFYADIDEQNLQNTSKSLGISGENLYHVNPAKPNSYSRKELINGFEDLRKLNLNGRERPIDYVIDCTGGNITGKEIMHLLLKVISQGGKFVTNSLNIRGTINMAHPQVMFDQQSVTCSISPNNNIPAAIQFLHENAAEFSASLVEIEGGLSKELAHFVQNGKVDSASRGNAYYTILE